MCGSERGGGQTSASNALKPCLIGQQREQYMIEVCGFLDDVTGSSSPVQGL